MSLPPNRDDFLPPRGLQAGVEYRWIPAELMKKFQDQGFSFANQFCDSNGVRYNLMQKGTPSRNLSPDNLSPSIEVHYPDAWDDQGVPDVTPLQSAPDESPITGQIEDPDLRDPETQEPPAEQEFSLDG